MTAVDFLLYCCGVALLLFSGAGAFRLVRGTSVKKGPPAPSTPGQDLTTRLLELQDQRFASPITQRPEREYVPSPGEPGGRRVVPPVRARPFSIPRQPPKHPAAPPAPPAKPKQETAKVIPLPVKAAPLDDTTKKD